jgi:XTP/dITP diphosphohydrolase
MSKKMSLLCATSNNQKFALGQHAFMQHNNTLEQILIDIDEIQGEDAEVILRDKAKKAFAIVGKPVLVSDDSWDIPALNGFPGAYMKSMNHWFSPADFINLIRDKEDKTIYLEQRLAYIDASGIVTFNKRIRGIIVSEPRGHTGQAIMHVVELEDDGMTIAELYDKGIANDYSSKRDAWNDAAQWYSKKL